MLIRSLSGFFLVAILLVSMFYSMQLFGFVWWILTLGAFYEAYNMYKSSGSDFSYIASSVLFLTSCFVGVLFKDVSYFLGAIVLVPLALIIIQMQSYRPGQGRKEFADKAIGFTLITYITVGYGSLFILTLQDWPTYILIFLFSINWFQDTFAYIGGRLVGRTSFSPYLSPKKTWEGALIGVLGAGILWAVIKFNFPQLIAPVLLDCYWILFLAVSISGQLGDLLESFFKRSFGVKDSGSLIPGHGGVLDRFDSVIIGSIILSLYICLQ